MTQYYSLFEHSPWLSTLIALSLLAAVAFIANFVVKKILLRLIEHLFNLAPSVDDGQNLRFIVISRLANVVPALVLIIGIPLVPTMPEMITLVIKNVANAFIVLTLARALCAVLDVVNELYMRRPEAIHKPIKGYLQVVKIGVYCIAAILIIAILIDKSPVILLSGLGAMAALLMLIFQDTLLSLVASVQITSNDMVRVGDWIEMPQLNADGDVIDIALHTVKVQNWDKTITTLPTRRLISDPFKNWRGMREAGGRRIKRALYLDQNSLHFLTEEEKDHLNRFHLLRQYLENKQIEHQQWNEKWAGEEKNNVNIRRLTNIGTFRAYVEQYLRHHPSINQKMTLMVRQLSPGPDGLPLEIYCFTQTTVWIDYESIQSDIFDHLYAILPEFGLQAYQQPSGRDLERLSSSFVSPRAT